ncbi:hypothetical protein ACQYWQ_13960 [Streptomyces sp. P6-2-1]|uniref:hypothetical protein n=1 Tax=unclassified Streptomyces TaxID=2593676 RepID=UPI003D369AE6
MARERRGGPRLPGTPATLRVYREATGWRSSVFFAGGGILCGGVPDVSTPAEARAAWTRTTEAVTRLRLTVRWEADADSGSWTGTVTEAAPA